MAVDKACTSTIASPARTNMLIACQEHLPQLSAQVVDHRPQDWLGRCSFMIGPEERQQMVSRNPLFVRGQIKHECAVLPAQPVHRAAIQGQTRYSK